jgi:hypothetical protein
MGGGGTQSINQRFNLSAINQSIYQQTTTNKNTSLASQTNIQTLTVSLEGSRACPIKLTQTIDATATSSSTLNNKQETEIKNAITTELTAAVGAQIEKVTEAGNMQFGDKQNINQDLNLEIKNIIDNSVVINNINDAIAEQVSIQDQIITVRNIDCREGGGLDFSQDIVAQLVADIVTTNLTDNIAASDLMNKLIAEADASQKTENKGIADIVDSIGNAFNGPLKYAMIASVVCCCMIVVLIVVMALSPGGQKGMGNFSKAGAARMGRKF